MPFLRFQDSVIRSHHTSSVRVVTLAACLLLIALNGSALWAQADANEADGWLVPAPGGDEAPSQTGGDIVSVSLISLLGKLALIGVLIYAAIWGLKQWHGRGIPTPHSGRRGLIRVREKVSLGTNGKLYVVQFGSRNLLICAVGDQVTLLTGNSASEMETDTSQVPASEEQVRVGNTSSLPMQLADGQSPTHPSGYGDTSQYQRQSHDANGAWVRAENFRRTADWENRRDALVRALQESVES